MASKGKGTIFRRKDGKYLLYLPLDVVEDTGFPFRPTNETSRRGGEAIPVQISFRIGERKVIIEDWKLELPSRPSSSP
jgi:hypothetical protein